MIDFPKDFPNGDGGKLLGHLAPQKTHAEKNKEVSEAIELLARTAATDQVRAIVEFYFAQIPELVGRMVATMLADAFAAHGLKLEAPDGVPVVSPLPTDSGACLTPPVGDPVQDSNAAGPAGSDPASTGEPPYQCGAFIAATGESCTLLSDHDGPHVFASDYPPTEGE